MTKSELDLVKKIRRYKKFAIENSSRTDFINKLREVDAYIAGRQYPDNVEEDFPYQVINIVSDFVDRMSAMIGGGRLDVLMQRRDEIYDDLVKMAKLQFDKWKEVSNFKGKNHEVIRDMVKYGVGVIHPYIDPTELIEMGGMIKLEVVYPGQIWINPLANDPYDPILGSDFIGYDTIVRRQELMERYPKSRSDIKNIEAYSFSDDGSKKTLGQKNVAISGVSRYMPTPTDFSTRGTTQVEPSDSKEDDYITVTEFEYFRIEKNEGGVATKVWYRCIVAGDTESEDSEQCVVLERETRIPYNSPTFVMYQYWNKSDSPWSMGVPSKIFDLQDLLNVYATSIMADTQNDSRWRNIRWTKVGLLGEDDKSQILSGKPPAIIELGDNTNPPEGSINDLVTQLRSEDNDYQKKLGTLNLLIDMARSIVGITSSATGDVNLEKRVSGVAVDTLQRATLLPQETPRIHIDAAVTNVASLVWRMMKHHWIVPYTISDPNGEGSFYVNQRMPMNVESAQMVEGMQRTQNFNIDGNTMIPTSVNAIDENNEETVFPISDTDGITEAIESGMFKEFEFGFNYLPILEIDVKCTIDAEYAQKQRQRMEAMMWANNFQPGIWSSERIMQEAMRDDPSFNTELENKKKFGDKIASLISEMNKAKIPAEMQDQLLNQLQQTVVAMVQQANQPVTNPQRQPQSGAMPQGVTPGGIQ